MQMTAGLEPKSPPCPGCDRTDAQLLVQERPDGVRASSYYLCEGCSCAWGLETYERRIWVVCGRRDEYEKYLAGRGHNPDYFRPANDRNAFYGVRKPTVILTGTYEQRHDWPAIKGELEDREATVRIDPL